MSCVWSRLGRAFGAVSRWSRAVRWVAAVLWMWVGLVLPAFATGTDSQLLGLSFQGDGSLPSAMSLFDAQKRAASTGRYLAEASPGGEASYGISFDLPVGLLSPSLGVSYSSSGGSHSVVGRGWSLRTGMTASRPGASARTAAYADTPWALMLSGGGLDGVLLPVAYAQNQYTDWPWPPGTHTWTYTGTEPAIVAAQSTFEDCTGDGVDEACLEIHSGGVTTTLAGDSDAGEYPPILRVVRKRDRQGNLVEYEWAGPYLERVIYGHSETDSEPVVEVLYTYLEDRGYRTFDSSGGHLEEIGPVLSGVEVFTRDGAGISGVRYGYELLYQEVDGEVMLESVVRVGGAVSDASALRRTVAWLDYARYADTAEDHVATGSDFWMLQVSATGVRGPQTRSVTYSRLADVTGDGLPDATSLMSGPAFWPQYFEFGGGGPQPRSAWLDAGSGKDFMADGLSLVSAQTFNADNGITGSGLDEAMSIRCAFEEEVTYGIRETLDLDGDGFSDLLVSLATLPEAWEPDQEQATWCDQADVQGLPVGGATWRVLWGEPDGGYSAPQDIAGVPQAWLSVEFRPDLPLMDPLCLEEDPTTSTRIGPEDCPLELPADLANPVTDERIRFAGSRVDLRDMNGDGWVDIVEVRENAFGLWVYLREPTRGGGWSQTAVDWTLGGTSGINAPSDGTELQQSLTALSVTEGRIDWDQWILDMNSGLEVYEGLEVLDRMTPVIGETYRISGLVDLNGDGLPDWVDAARDYSGVIVPAPLDGHADWDVWLGTPNGFALQKQTWRVPGGQRFLGLTDEGRAHVQSRSMPTGYEAVEFASTLLGTCEEHTFTEGSDCTFEYSYNGSTPTVDVDCTISTPSTFCTNGESGVIPSDLSGEEAQAAQALYSVQGGPGSSRWKVGWPQRQLSSLMDVDSDGRPDLVVFPFVDSSLTRDETVIPTGTWYRNLGDQFDQGRPTPAFWGWDLGANESYQTALINPIVGSLEEDDRIEYQKYNGRSLTGNRAVASVGDLNGDRIPDVVYREFSFETDEDGRVGLEGSDWTVLMGTGARPGLLTSIETNHGALTQLEYTSSSFSWPSGDLYEPHTMAQHKPLLTGMTVEDQVSGHAAHRSVEYEGGVCEGGECWGFEDVVVTEYLHDPDIHPAVDPFGGGGRPFQAMSRTSTSYWLDRDYAVPVMRTVDTSSIMPTPDPGGGWNSPLDWQRSRTEWSYAFTSGPVATARVGTRMQQEFGPPESGAVEAMSVHLVREAETELVTDVVHTNGVYATLVDPLAALTDDEENVHVHIDYAWSTDGELRLPIGHQTTGHDPVFNVWTLQEEGRFYYDGSLSHGQGITDGLLTRQEVDAGRPAGTGGALSDDVLVWEFTYTDRGAMASMSDPRGAVSTSSSFVFGGALPEVQSQSVNIGYGPESDPVTGEPLFAGELTLSTNTAYDALGRAVEVTDSNGLVARTTFDALGRPLSATSQALGAPERTVSATVYHDDDFTFPKVIEAQSFEYDAASGGTSFTKVSSFQVLDGFADPIQQWTPSVDAGEYLVDNAVRDITGAVVRTSVPRKVALGAGQLPDMLQGAGTEWLSWSELDAFGSPHRSWQHKGAGAGAGVGEVEYSYPEPGVVISEDEAGYFKEAHHDSHGRLVEVWEGRNGFVNMAADACQDVVSGDVRQKTGEYLYDSRGRVALFVDGADNAYLYGFDGAGRLRQVWREAAVGAPPPDSFLEAVDCRTHTEGSLEDGGQMKLCGSGSLLAGPVIGAQPWYSYSWDGHLPVQTWEGSWDVLLTTTSYDELGRPLLKDVFNEDEGTQGEGQWTTYAWSYDLDWLGAVSWQSDPAGKVTYDYAAEPVWGRRGLATSQTRTWNEVAYSATVDTVYDSLGQVVQTVLPDGTTVDATYAPGGWLTGHVAAVVDPKGVDPDRTATVDYQYNERGELLGYNAAETSSWLTTPAGSWQAVIDRGPTRINRVTWNHNGVEKQFLDLAYDDMGRLREKRYLAIAGESAIVYDYDALQRVSCMVHQDISAGDTTLETYRYDPIGNPTLVQRPGSSKSPAWDYASAYFSQVPNRFNQTTGRWDVHEYDPLGRMTRWDEVDIDPAVMEPGDPSLVTRTFDYDGLGRVVRHTMDDDPRSPGLTSDTLLVYDADNQAVYEERTIDRWETITRWGGERIDWGTTGLAQDVTLQLLPMLRAQNGELRWVMSDQSGAAFQIWASDGTELQFELGGVYGERLDDPTADWFHENPAVPFEDWRLDGLHGSEPDRVRGLVHHGARHTLLDDGRWLQPEPLLAVGATSPAVSTNYAMYAAGNPLSLSDRSGFEPTDDEEEDARPGTEDQRAATGELAGLMRDGVRRKQLEARERENSLANQGVQATVDVVDGTFRPEEMHLNPDSTATRIGHGVGYVVPGGHSNQEAAKNIEAGDGTVLDVVELAGAVPVAKGIRGAARLGNVVEASDVPLVITARHGLLRSAPKHHIFPQEYRAWFEARGVDIDRYTIKITEGDHTALHFGDGGGWWNAEIMGRLTAREAVAGRNLTPREILQEGAILRREVGLQDVKVEGY